MTAQSRRGINNRIVRRAHIARLTAFIEECRAGRAEMPLYGDRPNFWALSRLLFGASTTIRADDEVMRKIVDDYQAERVRKRRDDLIAATGFSLVRSEHTAAPPKRRSGSAGKPPSGKYAELRAFVDRCHQGLAEFPLHSDGTPNYSELGRQVSRGPTATRPLFLSHDPAVRAIVNPYLAVTFQQSPNRPRLALDTESLVFSAAGVPVNTDPARYALLPWDRKPFARSMKRIAASIFSSPVRIPTDWRIAFSQWQEILDEDGFEEWVGQVLAAPSIRGTNVNVIPLRLLYSLRLEKVLLPPLGLLADLVPKPFAGIRIAPAKDCFTEWELAVSGDTARRNALSLRSLFLNVGPVHRVEDFPRDEFVLSIARTLGSHRCESPSHKKFLTYIEGFARRIDHALMAAGVDPALRITPRIQGAAKTAGWRGHPGRTDPFSLPMGPVVGVWAARFREFVDAQHWKSPQYRVHNLSRVLAYLEAQRDPPPLDAPDLRARLLDEARGLPAWLQEASTTRMYAVTLAVLRRFFEWHAKQTDGFSVPLHKDDVPQVSHRSKTNKALIPRLILDEAKQICRELLAAAFAESNQAPTGTHNASAFERQLRCRVPIRGTGLVSMLTPQLPALLLTLLTLPIRSVQARLLDSGEADETVPILREGRDPPSQRVEWISNTGPLATPDRKQGCIRLIRDPSVWKDYLGFWINTNKTSAMGRGQGTDFGFEIPWQHDEIIEVLLRLREWQATHNPATRLYGRDDLTERLLRPSKALARRMPKYTFLFRHPRNGSLTTWHEPVRYDELGQFLLLVLDEIELRRRGTEREISLITSRRANMPSSAVYSLHGLRVAGITAFAEAGVPAPVIAEFLAGHLTVLMTVYYQKFGPATVTKMLDDAVAAMERGVATTILGEGSDVERIRKAFVSEGSEAFLSAADTSPGLWAIKVDGACPNGQTRCAVGGKRDNSSMYGPVPGGARNCPLCRFWMTGPTFISGQVIALNAVLYKLREKSEQLVALHEKRRAPSTSVSQLDAVEHSIDALEAEIDMQIRTLQARYRLAMASIHLSEAKGHEMKTALVTAGAKTEVAAAFTEMSDLRFLDLLSRSVQVFPELDCHSAPLKRAVLIDQLLDRDGFQALLFKLPLDAAARAGSAFGRFLSDAVGDAGVDAIANGSRSLRDLDVDGLEKVLSDALREPIRLVNRESGRNTLHAEAATPLLVAVTAQGS